MWRSFAVLAILLMAVAGLHQLVWIPLQCNRVKGEVARSTRSLEERPERLDVGQRARENGEKLTPCLRRQPRDIDLLVLAGANLYFAGRHDAARELYCGALRYDLRPELYLGCGEMQLLAGDRKSALENFVRAGEFAGPRILSRVSDGELRIEAHRIVGERIEANLAARGELDADDLVQNGTFASRSESLDAPAESWTWVKRGRIPVQASLEPSRRRASGQALHLQVKRRGDGIAQTLPPRNRRPRVIASAWVFVNQGTVCLGSGNGRPPLTNVCSQSTGQWEKLEAMNEACPATMVTLVSGSDEADFIVDEVHARVTYRAPCGRQ